ncbi:TetR/AcrR family transcriptional regulator [Oceanisphaera pacifica]|uniref:TetR/AcrR family transcriptional regulator n=1 Tax=Oceanisphaera pacifica TaxID=2818389 RepID=A0ABS3NH15_9GAMM|nr:TetR/AcrR family transcriptional regulator [Oceanisphaera pacifica]MBO1519878.1 TetR/AcrR family transcriptional regulator [Oceanisphaera pacifica]
MKTKERIISAALLLFNEQGEANVTTNHIAANLGISPGNLYYHFRNKNDIIHCIFLQYRDHLRQSFTPIEGPASSAVWIHYLDAIFYVMWEFRFFYANLNDILQRDSELHRQYLEVQQELTINLQLLLRELNRQQVLMIPDDEVDDLTEVLKMLVSFWVSYQSAQSLNPKISQSVLYKGVSRVLLVLKPYFHLEHGSELANLMAHYQALAATPSDPFHK